MPHVVVKQRQSISWISSKYFDVLAAAEKHHVVYSMGHQQPVGLSLLPRARTGRSATAAVLFHSEDWAGNIFLNTSTVMLTSASACQRDILLGDKGGMPYRMTVYQACRQENSGADQWGKKSEKKLSGSLPASICLW